MPILWYSGFDYSITCNSTNNTPDVIERNELRASIGIVPTQSVEFWHSESVLCPFSGLSIYAPKPKPMQITCEIIDHLDT